MGNFGYAAISVATDDFHVSEFIFKIFVLLGQNRARLSLVELVTTETDYTDTENF